MFRLVHGGHVRRSALIKKRTSTPPYHRACSSPLPLRKLCALTRWLSCTLCPAILSLFAPCPACLTLLSDAHPITPCCDLHSMTPKVPELPRPEPPPRDVSTHSKLSVPESSHSNEADDEESMSEEDLNINEPPAAPRQQYEGEDTRLTSDKELSGFYMYGWAAEVRRSLETLLRTCN